MITSADRDPVALSLEWREHPPRILESIDKLESLALAARAEVEPESEGIDRLTLFAETCSVAVSILKANGISVPVEESELSGLAQGLEFCRYIRSSVADAEYRSRFAVMRATVEHWLQFADVKRSDAREEHGGAKITDAETDLGFHYRDEGDEGVIERDTRRAKLSKRENAGFRVLVRQYPTKIDGEAVRNAIDDIDSSAATIMRVLRLKLQDVKLTVTKKGGYKLAAMSQDDTRDVSG